MNSEEINEQLLNLKAQALATQMALQLVVSAIPGLATALRSQIPLQMDVLLHSDMPDPQKDLVERTLRLICGGSGSHAP